MTNPKSTVWFRVDPESDRRRLIEDAQHHLRMLGFALDHRVDQLDEQGYAIRAEDLDSIVAMIDRFDERLRRAIARARIDHVGPPKGKVAPPEVEAAFRADPTRQSFVTNDDAETVGTVSRSRH